MAIGDRILTHADIVAANAAKAPAVANGVIFNPIPAPVPFKERVKALQRRMESDAPPAPQSGSKWLRSDTGEHVTIICAAIDVQGQEPRAMVVYRSADGANYCVGLEFFHEVLEHGPTFASIPSRIQATPGIAPVIAHGRRRRFERQAP